MTTAILYSDKLRTAGVTHGFTTRRIGDVLGSLRGWEKATGLRESSVVWLNQVHGNDVLVVDQPAGVCADGRDLRYDAAVTDRSDVVLSVRTADCVPILLYCPAPRAVGIVHAGWRGTLKGVATSAVSMLNRAYGCRPESLIAAIGPCIKPCCYEVGDEVYRPFVERFGSEAVSVVGHDSNSGNGHGAKYVHLAAANRIWLIECGLAVENVEIIDLCTCCKEELFFSYRREGAKSGRQLAYISLDN